MQSPDAIRRMIARRVLAACDSCNSDHQNHVHGQIRGLLWTLLGGDKMPPNYASATDILDAAGIPYTLNGEEFDISDEWLESK